MYFNNPIIQNQEARFFVNDATVSIRILIVLYVERQNIALRFCSY